MITDCSHRSHRSPCLVFGCRFPGIADVHGTSYLTVLFRCQVTVRSSRVWRRLTDDQLEHPIPCTIADSPPDPYRAIDLRQDGLPQSGHRYGPGGKLLWRQCDVLLFWTHWQHFAYHAARTLLRIPRRNLRHMLPCRVWFVDRQITCGDGLVHGCGAQLGRCSSQVLDDPS